MALQAYLRGFRCQRRWVGPAWSDPISLHGSQAYPFLDLSLKSQKTGLSQLGIHPTMHLTKQAHALTFNRPFQHHLRIWPYDIQHVTDPCQNTIRARFAEASSGKPAMHDLPCPSDLEGVSSAIVTTLSR